MNYIIKIAQGTKAQHEELTALAFPAGSFSLVTDAPQLRFFDGLTPAGVVVPLSPIVHKQIMRHYYKVQLTAAEVTPAKSKKKERWFTVLYRGLLYGKDKIIPN